MNRKMIQKRVVSILPLLSMLLYACSANYGSLMRNPALPGLYENRALLPDYNYYYAGRSNLPYAVIGLEKQYQFSTMGWFKIEDHDDVYDKISRLDDRPDIGVSNTMVSADIIDQDGNKIGIWFSYYHHTVVKTDPGTKTAVVLNPYSPGVTRPGL
ncbi:MAG TPA: hypothetical protein DHV36_09180 [Desulfobacteraceae bacterium]|nr:hypothetical protein [Desulfobacteraceae bacterium]|tara:strand:+ start:363 stop:830 length:468 start_codon:yes stop_codon:yes gene_type:complete